MAVVRCRKCGAVATVRYDGERVAATCGEDFRSKCGIVPQGYEGDLVALARQCPNMAMSVDRAAFRMPIPPPAEVTDFTREQESGNG
jgi:ferredoxin